MNTMGGLAGNQPAPPYSRAVAGGGKPVQPNQQSQQFSGLSQQVNTRNNFYFLDVKM